LADIHLDLVGRSTTMGYLIQAGVTKPTRAKRFHRYRSYVLSDGVQILARNILACVGKEALEPKEQIPQPQGTLSRHCIM